MYTHHLLGDGETKTGATTDDSPLGCAVSSLAQTLSAVTEAYRYEFNDQNAPTPPALNLPPEFSLGAYHGSELQYLFKMTRVPGLENCAAV